MLPVSSTFLAALRSSHEAIFRVTLCDPPGQTGVAPTGVELLLTEGGGSVTLDAEADVRGRCTLDVTGPWPEDFDPDTAITPYGSEVFISRGISLGNGAIERAPLGYYRLSEVEQSDAPAGSLSISGEDRMQGIIEARLEEPVSFDAASTYGAVVELLVSDVYPGATIEWDGDDGEVIGRTIVAEEDRYAVILDLVTSLGKVAFFDYRGVLVIAAPPDPTVPVWEVSGGTDGVLVELSRSLNRDGVYNAVVATGEALDDTPPVRGVAYDLDPESPTYWNGPFGKVPRYYSSPLLTTEAQAIAAAESLLATSTGLPYMVDFAAVPNPALEPLDVVRVVYPRVGPASPQTEVHVISQVRIPLSSTEAMPSVTRKQTL